MKRGLSWEIDNNRQSGVAAVEFAIVAALFFSLLIGIMEMGRVLFYWNTATEATRLGARVAVVCDVSDTAIKAIKAKMTSLFPTVPANKIEVLYIPAGCGPETCDEVTVRIQPVPIATYIPLVPLKLSLPAFATTLPRESLASSINDVDNPTCK